MEKWLVTKLGSLVSDRIYGGMAPADTPKPYIVFRQVSGVRVGLDIDTEKNSDRWQIDSFTDGSYTVGRDLVKSIRSALDVRGHDNGLCILSSSFDSEDMYDESVETHYQSSDFLVDYLEE